MTAESTDKISQRNEHERGESVGTDSTWTCALSSAGSSALTCLSCRDGCRACCQIKHIRIPAHKKVNI